MKRSTLLPSCSSTSSSSNRSKLSHRIMIFAVGSLVIFIVALLSDSSVLIRAAADGVAVQQQEHTTPPVPFRVLTASDLRSLLTDIQGDDHRMVRWDATEHTADRQASVRGGCDISLPDVWSTLLYHDIATTTKNNKEKKSVSPNNMIEVQGLACEYATFCITDNPQHRASLVNHQGVHQVIVNLVGAGSATGIRSASDTSSGNGSSSTTTNDSDIDYNQYASAMASHLIYIASFANAANHALFYEAGAVPALAAIVKHSDNHPNHNQGNVGGAHGKKATGVAVTTVRPVQIMWAAAALQNLAASYCATPDDGRCYWDWPTTEDGIYTAAPIQITKDSLPLVTDGSRVRTDMLQDAELVERLVSLTCQGPVHGSSNRHSSSRSSRNNNPFPGVNAIAHTQHDDSPTIVPWAAAGALKNLALALDASSTTDALQSLQSVVPCLCRLAHVSPDWLEQNKGEGALHHLRRGGSPCWFGAAPAGNDYQHGKLCVDHVFIDAEGYTCTDYGDASEKECAKAAIQGDNGGEVTPNQACCGCGGGEREAHGRRTEEL
jgi:hypothetical protein